MHIQLRIIEKVISPMYLSNTMDKATSLSVLIVVLLMAVSLTLALTQQQPTTGQTTTNQVVNFTKLFKQKFTASSYLGAPAVSVVYQSPTTIILQGHAKILNTKIALVNNRHLWQATDIIKEHGFTIDSVLASGLSTVNNPLVYHIVLSHK
jgi:hypothetical protein